MRKSLYALGLVSFADRTPIAACPVQAHDPPRSPDPAVGVAAARHDTERARRSEASWRSRRGEIGLLALAPMWAWSRRARADSGADASEVIEFSPDDKRLLYDEIASKVVLQA